MTPSEAIIALKTKDPSNLKDVFASHEKFPHGRDDLFGRYWIVNAIDSGSYETIEWMLSQDVDLTFEDNEGYPPIHSCLEREGSDRYDVLELLLKFGADVDARGINDWTPLHMAAVRNDFRAMEILLAAGSDRSRRTRIDDFATPEEEARALGNEEAAEFLSRQK